MSIVHGSPIVGIDLLARVIERVVIILPCVFLRINLILIQVVMKFDVGKGIFEFAVVMVRDRGKRVEEIRVHCSCFWHVIPRPLLITFLLLSVQWLSNTIIKKNKSRVSEKMHSVAHTTELRKRVAHVGLYIIKIIKVGILICLFFFLGH